jgi:hypothetical protein
MGASYIDRFRSTLAEALTLYDTPCQARVHTRRRQNQCCYIHLREHCTDMPLRAQVVERYSKPEVEVQDSPELLLAPVMVCRNAHERFLVERSINSVRISLKARRALSRSPRPWPVQRRGAQLLRRGGRCARRTCWRSGWSANR